MGEGDADMGELRGVLDEVGDELLRDAVELVGLGGGQGAQLWWAGVALKVMAMWPISWSLQARAERVWSRVAKAVLGA